MPLRPTLKIRRKGVARLLRSFLQRGDGATAVEFALVALPFFALVFAIIETALAFWAGQILDTALANATRSVYTGSFQGKNPSASGNAQILANLRNAMCYPNGDTTANANVTIFDCGAVKIEVLAADQFSAITANDPIDAGTGDWAKDFGTRYTTPQPGQAVIVQAAVKFPVFATLLNPSQSSFKDGTRVLRATVAFRAEPY